MTGVGRTIESIAATASVVHLSRKVKGGKVKRHWRRRVVRGSFDEMTSK